MKVIYHVDEMAKWPLTLTNVSNMLAVYKQQGEAYKIEVLANSAAVKQYAQADELEENMTALAKEGILFTACGNALKANQLKAEELYPFVEAVSAGVVELAKRQAEGYAYIKP